MLSVVSEASPVLSRRRRVRVMTAPSGLSREPSVTCGGMENAPVLVAAPTVRRTHHGIARKLLVLVVLALAVHFLLPQLAMAGAMVHALGAFQWAWLPVIGAAAAVSYVMAAVALRAASGRSLPLGRTVAAQVAAAFTNRLAPAGVGAMATNVRYLEASGLTRTAGMTAVALNSMAGLLVHIAAIAAVFT